VCGDEHEPPTDHREYRANDDEKGDDDDEEGDDDDDDAVDKECGEVREALSPVKRQAYDCYGEPGNLPHQVWKDYKEKKNGQQHSTAVYDNTAIPLKDSPFGTGRVTCKSCGQKCEVKKKEDKENRDYVMNPKTGKCILVNSKTYPTVCDSKIKDGGAKGRKITKQIEDGRVLYICNSINKYVHNPDAGNNEFGKNLITDFKNNFEIPKTIQNSKKLSVADFKGTIVKATAKGYGGTQCHADFAIDVKLDQNGTKTFQVEEKSSETNCKLSAERPFKIAVQFAAIILGPVFKKYSEIWFKEFIESVLIPDLMPKNFDMNWDEYHKTSFGIMGGVQKWKDPKEPKIPENRTKMIQVKTAYEKKYPNEGENITFAADVYIAMAKFFGDPKKGTKSKFLEVDYNKWIQKVETTITESNKAKEIWLQSCGLVATEETKEKCHNDKAYKLKGTQDEWKTSEPEKILWSGPILLPTIRAGIIWPDIVKKKKAIIRVQYLLETKHDSWMESPFSIAKEATETSNQTYNAPPPNNVYAIQPNFVKKNLEELGVVDKKEFIKNGKFKNKNKKSDGKLFWSKKTYLRFGNRLAGFRGDFK